MIQIVNKTKIAALLFLLIFIDCFNLTAQNKMLQLNNIITDNNLSGIQLIYNNGVTTASFNNGVIKKGSKQKISSKTVFRAGSLGKSVFAYAVMRLYDKGVIAIDTPLLQYLGSYGRFDKNDPRFAKITARMVLSHTSGLDEFEDPEKVKLLFEPGASFFYSGEGIWFLQKTIEKLTGKSLEEIMKAEVFNPLKMLNSTYLHIKNDNEKMLGADNASIAWAYPNAAFSLITSANDYEIFLNALLAGKGLKPSTRQMFFTKQSSAQRYGELNTKPDDCIDWGLGVGLQQNEKGKAIWHWGNFADEFYSFYIVFPATGQNLVFFTRGASGLKITGPIINLFLGKQTSWAVKWLHMDYDYPETMNLLYKLVRQQGNKNIAGILNQLKKSGHIFSERDLNYYGLLQMNKRKYQKAEAVFKQQIGWYPKSANAYDNYGEINECLGNNLEALNSYKRSFAIDTTDLNAKYHISALAYKQNITAYKLKVFEGKFYRDGKRNDLFLKMKTNENKLELTQSWDDASLKFFRVSEFEFYNSSTGFLLKFAKDNNGKITKAFVGTMLPWVKITD